MTFPEVAYVGDDKLDAYAYQSFLVIRKLS